jgi:primosomal protein N' (replication factor Y) (superfamily II helicase)
MSGLFLERYVGVLLPLAVEKPYTYAVPPEWQDQIAFGMRVEVQFGSARHYSGLVVETDLPRPDAKRVKPVLNVLDKAPLITKNQYALWRWMADYYGCTTGEVMSAALPSHLKLSSETRILAGPMMEEALPELHDDAYLIAEALSIREELGVEDVRLILNRKNVYPLLLDLLHQRIILFKEELQERFKPKTVTALRAGPALAERSAALAGLFREMERSPRQTAGLMAFLDMEKQGGVVLKKELLARAEISDAVFRSLVDRGVLEPYPLTVSRLEGPLEEDPSTWKLSAHQQEALSELRRQWEEKQVLLLQGITGSGKTLLYAELIREQGESGRQVLYLLPEIALTTQLVLRLEQLTGREVLPYHSRLNQHERVEIWQSVMTRPDALVVAPRSGLFLPWSRLGLVIVDEEHDASYKQQDPSPRYQGRDTAIMLAHICGAKTLLGSATPSLESWYHAGRGKYGRVALQERFGEARLPEIRLINLRQESTKGEQGLFTPTLLKAMEETLARREQIILFQNRRGFAPSLRCELCGWVQECVHCDVSLTYHKPTSRMHCHYCGYQTGIPPACPTCGNRKLLLKGFGTQRVEDDLKIFFPEARVARLDMDTARSRSGLLQLLDDFSERRVDILVGTQMVTKGLDFDNLGLVGVLQADQLLAYPDFRAAERAFQLMTQVAGRAGRKSARSLVLIQTWDPAHAVMQDVLHQDLEGFYRRELAERKALFYPPFSRIIRLLIKHKVEEKAAWAADQLVAHLAGLPEDQLQGPATPPVSRIGGYYLRSIQIKLGLSPRLGRQVREAILAKAAALRNVTGMSGLIIQLDVDPA